MICLPLVLPRAIAVKNFVPTILIVFGGLLALGPVAAHTYSIAREKDRIATLSYGATNAATLPREVEPMHIEPCDWSCLAVGVVMVVVGIIWVVVEVASKRTIAVAGRDFSSRSIDATSATEKPIAG